MATFVDHVLTSTLHDAARPLVGAPHDFDALLALVGQARFVLIGEASHGTHELYAIRPDNEDTAARCFDLALSLSRRVGASALTERLARRLAEVKTGRRGDGWGTPAVAS